MTVRKVIQRKEIFDLREDALNPEEVLGDLASVEEMAFIWSKYRESLKTIELSSLLDFCRAQKFNSEELIAYRKGLETMNIFIEKCFMAVNDNNKK